MRAIWNHTVIAESDETVVVEGNHYFPPSSLATEHLVEVDQTSVCPWKGTAEYFDVVVGDERSGGAAFVYRDPKPEAENIRDHVAFWKGVAVEA